MLFLLALSFIQAVFTTYFFQSDFEIDLYTLFPQMRTTSPREIHCKKLHYQKWQERLYITNNNE